MPVVLARRFRKRSPSSRIGEPCRCAACRRTPVPGETLHVFEGERILCTLCLLALPEADRRPVRLERMRASERRLAVAPRAA
jgi:hypothetical protein